MSKNIYLDMDGVIADFVGSALKVHGVNNKNFPHTPELYEIEKDLGISSNSFWKKIDERGEDFWSNLEEYPWTRDLINFLDNCGGFCILSSPSKSPNCVSGKLRWIQKLLGSDFRDYIFAPAFLKSRLSSEGRVLIDDSTKNCYDFSKGGGDSILFPQPWNRLNGFKGDKLEHVKEMVIHEYRN